MSDLRIGLIGGTGLGEALAAEGGEKHEMQTPFGHPSGPILTSTWEGIDIAILQRHGPGHRYGPATVPYRANIYALKTLGVTHIVASGATGSLREQIQPRDLVIPDQVIDKTHQRAHTFFEEAAVHVELAEPFCPLVRRWLIDAARELEPEGIHVHQRGTYVCMEGPAFSTRAESHMHRAWGGDLIGMTVMPEAKLAREAELPYGLIALPTDYDCWRPHEEREAPQQLLQEITDNLRASVTHSIQLIKLALSDPTVLEENTSPVQDALKLAIWSDRTKIPARQVERLRPIWGRYF